MSEFQHSEEFQLKLARYHTIDLISMAVMMTAVACVGVAIIAWMSGVWA